MDEFEDFEGFEGLDDFDQGGFEEFDQGDFGGETFDDDSSIAIENAYYQAKNLKDTDPLSAISGFKTVLDLDQFKSLISFKATKHLCLLYRQLSNYDEVLKYYTDLLAMCHNPVVSRGDFERTIMTILDDSSLLDSSSLRGSSKESQFFDELYNKTLTVLETDENFQRFSLKVLLKLGNFYIDHKKYHQAENIIKKLHYILGPPENSLEDTRRAAIFLEVIALELVVCRVFHKTRKIKSLSALAEKLKKLSVAHPHVWG
ncbi:hypothetical protein GEMRC1_000243 [Eukaryota sp. GEM-RC1]